MRQLTADLLFDETNRQQPLDLVHAQVRLLVAFDDSIYDSFDSSGKK
jgi:hypothetical protein